MLFRSKGDFLFAKNGGYTLGAGGDGKTVECQDHGCEARNVLGRRILLFNDFERCPFIIFRSRTSYFQVLGAYAIHERLRALLECFGSKSPIFS